MLRRQRTRPFAANDSKRISDDYEMLYPGLLDGRRHGSDGSIDVYEPLRTIVDGLFPEQSLPTQEHAASRRERPNRNDAGSAPVGRSHSNPERASSTQTPTQTETYSCRATAHVESARPDCRSRARTPPPPPQRQRPRLTRNTSSSERISKCDRSQHSFSTLGKPPGDKRSRSRYSRPTRPSDQVLPCSAVKPDPNYNREDELAEYQRLNDEMMRDLDEWFNSQPSMGSMDMTRSYNTGMVY